MTGRVLTTKSIDRRRFTFRTRRVLQENVKCKNHSDILQKNNNPDNR